VIRTLVVDDDFMVAGVHADYVERVEGFTVVGKAHSGAEAIELAASCRPQLVLLDLYLPDIGGLDVARRLREPGQPAVDVIVITAARDVGTVRGAFQAGALHYLVKPFSFPTFREKLETYRTLARSLDTLREADQQDIDRLYGTLRGTSSSTPPKGLSAATLELVEKAIRDAPTPLSADQVSQVTGVSRVTARRYLEHLAWRGRVELTLRYGTTGRPMHLYQRSRGPA
jgi:response regulator of citrate/malate metabolism